MESTYTRKTMLNAGWQKIYIPQPRDAKPKYFSFRDWQREAYESIVGSQHAKVNAPTASGKSKLALFDTITQLKKDPSLRAIIAVPQTIIGTGFREAGLAMPGGTNVDWRIPSANNLCDGNISTQGNIASLLGFVSAPAAPVLNNRVLLCTHQTLGLAFKRLTDEERERLFKNLLVWIDESHHVSFSTTEQDTEIVNNLGSVVKYLLDNEDKNLYCRLMTATFTRSDGLTILPRTYQRKFTRYDLPYDKYMSDPNMSIKGFSVDFITYTGSYLNPLRELFAGDIKKTIVYIPRTNSTCEETDKITDANTIISLLGGTQVDNGDHIVVTYPNGKRVNVINLVDPTNRQAKKDFLAKRGENDPKINEDPDALDLVISMNMGKEGFDWVWANRVVVIGARNSMGEMIQILGRILRSAEGKETVEASMLLPNCFNAQGAGSTGELNDYVKAVFLCMLLEDVMKPMIFRMPSETKAPKATDREKANLFVDLVESIESRAEIQRRGLEIMLEIKNFDEGISPSDMFLQYEKQLSEELVEDLACTKEQADAIAFRVWALCTRPILSDGIDVAEIDCDLIKQTDPLSGFDRYTTGMTSVSVFDRLKEALRRTNFVQQAREEFLSWVKAAGRKPRFHYSAEREGTMAQYFKNFTNRDNPRWYSEDFVQFLQCHYPFLFPKTIKEILLDLMDNGFDKPKQHGKRPEYCIDGYTEDTLAASFCAYTNPNNNNSFDSVFAEQTRQRKPEWLMSVSDIVANKKKNLLDWLAEHNRRPNRRSVDIKEREAGLAFYTYITAGVTKTRNGKKIPNPTYDAQLVQEVKTKYPHVFEKQDRRTELIYFIETNDEFPSRYAATARTDLNKQKEYLRMYSALHRYVRLKQDAEIRSLIERKRPHWLQKMKSLTENLPKKKTTRLTEKERYPHLVPRSLRIQQANMKNQHE